MNRKRTIYFATQSIAPREGAGVEVVSGYSNDLDRLKAWVRAQSVRVYRDVSRYYPHEINPIETEVYRPGKA